MEVLKADVDACLGYANCVRAADDYFDVTDEGVVELVTTDVPETDHERVMEAVRTCPVAALTLDQA